MQKQWGLNFLFIGLLLLFISVMPMDVSAETDGGGQDEKVEEEKEEPREEDGSEGSGSEGSGSEGSGSEGSGSEGSGSEGSGSEGSGSEGSGSEGSGSGDSGSGDSGSGSSGSGSSGTGGSGSGGSGSGSSGTGGSGSGSSGSGSSGTGGSGSGGSGTGGSGSGGSGSGSSGTGGSGSEWSGSEETTPQPDASPPLETEGLNQNPTQDNIEDQDDEDDEEIDEDIEEDDETITEAIPIFLSVTELKQKNAEVIEKDNQLFARYNDENGELIEQEISTYLAKLLGYKTDDDGVEDETLDLEDEGNQEEDDVEIVPIHASNSNNTGLIIGLGLLGVGVVSTLIYFLIKRRIQHKKHILTDEGLEIK